MNKWLFFIKYILFIECSEITVEVFIGKNISLQI